MNNGYLLTQLTDDQPCETRKTFDWSYVVRSPEQQKKPSQGFNQISLNLFALLALFRIRTFLGLQDLDESRFLLSTVVDPD
jgi:hypothetical protein